LKGTKDLEPYLSAESRVNGMKKNSYVNSDFGDENNSGTKRDEVLIFMACTNYLLRDYP
jgi:hypothetical protein